MDRPRSVVLVIAPESLFQSRASAVQLPPGAAGRSKDHASTGTHHVAHNEIERRRKDRIRRCVRQLSETLKPPCQCGKATTAEVLQKVVNQIDKLQRENEDLKQRIAQQSRPASGGDSELQGRLVELLFEQSVLKAKLLGHQEGGEIDGTMTTTVTVEAFATDEVQPIGREEETWGEEDGESDEGQSKPSSLPASEAQESGSSRIDEQVPQQQPWPVTSLLSFNDSHKQNGAEQHPVVDTPPCTSAFTRQAVSRASLDVQPPLSHHSPRVTSILPLPHSTSPSLVGNSGTLVSSGPQETTLTSVTTPSPSLMVPRRTNALPPRIHVAPATITDRNLPSSQPPTCTIVQPWVDTASGSKRLRHHSSLGFPQGPHSIIVSFPDFSPHSHNQQGPCHVDHPHTTSTAMRSSMAVSHNEIPPLHRETSLRFRPYQPPQACPRTQGRSSRNTPTASPVGHSATLPPKNRRFTIHPPLTADDFPRSPRNPRHNPPWHEFLHHPNGAPGTFSSPDKQYSLYHRPPPPPPPPPPPYFNSEQNFPHMRPPPSPLPIPHHSYSPYPPPPPPPPPPQPQIASVWRPYSERTRGSGFCLADIISLPSSEDGGDSELQLVPPPLPPPTTNPGRIPSFLVDHLLDGTGI